MVANKNGLFRDFIIHPGETIAEFLEERGMSQKELAIRCGVSEKHISTVISGQKNISALFAKKLEYALDIDAVFWMNLQTNYDRELLEFEEINNITDEELGVQKNLRDIFKEYKKYGFLEQGLSKYEELIEARKLFKISNLLDIPKMKHIGAYRLKNDNSSVDDYVLFAWERLCELMDENSDDSTEFNISLLEKSIPDIKKIMFEDANLIIPRLKEIFSNCGISFYLVKNFTGAPVQGYMRKNKRNGLSLYMTIRGSFADIFWFSLFHEIAHILNGDAKNTFVDFNEISNDIEKRADACAREMLISKKSYEKFIKESDFSLNSISELAQKNNVQLFICLGRLMKDNYISWNTYSNYRQRYRLCE